MLLPEAIEGPDLIYVGGLPCYFTEAHVRELMESFGALKGLSLMKDRETGSSKGFGFCAYQDSSATDIACAALNGLRMGENTLTFRRANQGQIQPNLRHNQRSKFSSFTGQIPGATPAVPGMFQNMHSLASSHATRHARRVYVGGLSPSANEQTLATFFSHVMAAIGGNTAGPGNAVVNVYIHREKNFAFVEMRSVEEASNAISLDGIIFEGAPVKVRRPSDYNPSLAAALGPSQPNPNLNLAAVGLIPGSAGGLQSPDCIFVDGFPNYFTETQVKELLESFGALRVLDFVKGMETGNSRGYAFCVYQDLSVTDLACAAFNGIKLGDETLTVRRANRGQINAHLLALQQIALQRLTLEPATKVLSLTQAVTEEELMNDDDYEDIMEDMKIECGKFGSLVNVVIPRPNPNGGQVTGVGKVFLEYADTESSTRARAGLNGRRFGGNQVVASFYPENKFSEGDYNG